MNFLIKGEGGNADLWINSLLIFIQKENLSGLRPLAIDEPLIRLTSKCINQACSEKVGIRLGPTQFGVGIKGGCEFVCHTNSMWVEEILKNLNSNKIIIRLDKKNAFNSIPRAAIRRGILKHCPELLWYFDWSYGSCTRLVLINGYIIGFSQNGVRQGDPLGPLFYCLGLDTVISEAQCRFPNVDIMYYLDDGHLHGEREDVFEAYLYLKDRLKSINQILDTLNPKKCIVFASSNACVDGIPDNLKMNKSGMVILGCPYGTHYFIYDELIKNINKLSVIINRLKFVDSKCAYVLLKFCINTKGCYLARVCTPWCLITHAKAFDVIIDSVIANWCDVDSLDELSSDIRSLPWGLKLPRLADISVPAFSNSFARALEFGRDLNHWSWAVKFGDICLNQHSSVINNYVKGFTFNHINPVIPPQKKNSIVAANLLFDNVLRQCDDSIELTSYLISLKKLYNPEEDSNCWLNWFKVKNRFSNISFCNDSFKGSIRFRLLIPSKSFSHQLICVCSSNSTSNLPVLINVNPKHSDVDLSLRKNMFHCFSCTLSSQSTIARHNRVVSLIQTFVTMFIPSVITDIEFPIKFYNNCTKKKTDLFIKINKGDRYTYFVDVRIFNVACKSHACSNETQSNLEFIKVEKIKRREYSAVKLQNDRRLIPFVVDTVGNIGPEATLFLDDISRFVSIDKCKFVKLFTDCLQIVLYSDLNSQCSKFHELIESKSINRSSV